MQIFPQRGQRELGVGALPVRVPAVGYPPKFAVRLRDDMGGINNFSERWVDEPKGAVCYARVGLLCYEGLCRLLL